MAFARYTLPFAIIASTIQLAAGSFQTPPIPLVPVVGHWEQVNDGGAPAVVADARKWDGRSGPDLPAIARQLFAKPDAAFAKNMDPATAFVFAALAHVDEFRGGTLTGGFKLIGGQSDQTGGLAFGLQPNGDYFYVRYNTKDGNVAVWEFTGGRRSVLAHGAHHAQIPLNTWHELTVRVTGRHVRGEMKGGFVVEHELPREVAGRIGFWTKRDAVTAFRAPRVDAAPR